MTFVDSVALLICSTFLLDNQIIILHIIFILKILLYYTKKDMTS